jgi:hypothetical protein
MTVPAPLTGSLAVLEATEKGNRKPLAARLRAVARRKLAMLWSEELDLAAGPDRPAAARAHASRVQARLVPTKSLAFAGAVLRVSHGHKRGEVADAVQEVAEKSVRLEGRVNGQITIARRYWGEDKWRFRCRKFRSN